MGAANCKGRDCKPMGMHWSWKARQAGSGGVRMAQTPPSGGGGAAPVDSSPWLPSRNESEILLGIQVSM